MAYISIDIGGTGIKAGLVTRDGEILFRQHVPTPSDSYSSLLGVLEQIVERSQAYASDHSMDIEGIALSQPCATDHMSGKALSDGALVYINGENPAKDLGEKYSLPYSAENDGNCAALAEVWLGAGRGYQNLALIVCGTGIGGAVVIDGKIKHGKNNSAGEFGMCITGFEQETGEPVSWSMNGSTLALVKDYARETGRDHSQIDGRYVFELADGGDPVAMACVQRFWDHFVIGLHTVQHVYDPQLILLGGGISSRKSIVAEVNEALDRLYDGFSEVLSRPVVASCAFEADANLIGAVYHLMNNYNKI